LVVDCRREQGPGPAGGGLRLRRPAARGSLRCSLWGRAAELASLTSFVALGHLPRVRLRSARVRAPTPELRSSPPHTQPATGRPRALPGTDRCWLRVKASRGHRARDWPRAAGALRGARWARCPARDLLTQQQSVPRREAGGGLWVRLCDGEERRASVGARTHALRRLTRGRCSSATNEVSEASSAARPESEYRSGVGAAGADRRSGAPTGPRPTLGARQTQAC
jgi:hypothetical protein